MEKTITKTFVKATNDGSGVNSSKYTVDANGNIPCMIVEYSNGLKFMAVITGMLDNGTSFEQECIRFKVKQFMFNQAFNKWDRTDSNKFTNSELVISNTFEVRSTDGKWKEELTS